MTIVRDESRFTQLTRALETGWEIEEPVLLGSMWDRSSRQGGTYHFVLRNKTDDKTTLLSLPPSPQLMIFLADNKININSLQA